jgi:ribosomal protein L32E
LDTPRLGALVKPATLFKFHQALVEGKYSSSSQRRHPVPKGPSPELIAAIVEMKQRNPRFDCVRIAQAGGSPRQPSGVRSVATRSVLEED